MTFDLLLYVSDEYDYSHSDYNLARLQARFNQTKPNR